jgi:hypothetical protein
MVQREKDDLKEFSRIAAKGANFTCYHLKSLAFNQLNVDKNIDT